jgi:spore photoproduct lyase
MSVSIIIFERKALKFDFGKNLYEKLNKMGEKVELVEKYLSIKEEFSDLQNYIAGKGTLIISARNLSKFEPCKPSSDFQLPLVIGCPGMCEYCYLFTRKGANQVSKINVNIEQVFSIADKYIKEKSPKITTFEISANSDSVPYEPLTGILSTAIEHFGKIKNSRLRVCTKFTQIDTLLQINHNKNTQFRFSLNTDIVIKEFEHGTPSLIERLKAASKLSLCGYKIGIMIAPVFCYDGWQKDYLLLLEQIKNALPQIQLTFEVVTHRYTQSAKANIYKLFPNSSLDMDDLKRQFKYGQFGYGKYIYNKVQMAEVKDFFKSNIKNTFENSLLLYIV